MSDIIQNARDLRKNSTEAEKLLWSRLRDRQIKNLKFKRQHAFPPYILDFFCEEHALAIELDGGQHTDPAHQEKDNERTNFLKTKGIRVLRFWNNEVLENIQGVLETVIGEIPSPQPSPGGRGSLAGKIGKRILIGEIATAHGIKGLVKLRSFVEDESLFKTAKVYTGETSDKTISLILKNQMKGDWLAEVKDVTDRNAAELLRGTKLYIDRDAMPEPDEGEYYIEDLKGLRVIDESGKDIGTVLSVENFGASDLLDIKPQSGASFYLPFTDDTIVTVDFDTQIITLKIPEAL